MRAGIWLTAGLALAAGGASARPVRQFLEVAVSPDGARVASVEGDETPSGAVDIKSVVIRPVAGGDAATVALPCGQVAACEPSSLAWAPDGRLAFVLRLPGGHAHAVYRVGADGRGLERLGQIDGTLTGLRYGPGGRLAVLAVSGANKEVGAVEAGAPMGGALGGDVHEQRIALVGDGGALRFVSPENLFVYEFDWRPDGGFVGTAAPGDGDDHWWVAKLYAFEPDGAARVLFAPPSPQVQLAEPRVSPDGTQVSFIGGLMSDFGATGGDAYVVSLREGKARNLTAGDRATVTGLRWGCAAAEGLLATRLHDDRQEVVRLDGAGVAAPVWSGTGNSGEDGPVLTCGTATTAVVHQDFTRPPEIAVGPLGQWRDLTTANAGLSAAVRVQSLHWRSDGFTVQGWLLAPAAGGRRPLITEVHGGPASAHRPYFVGRERQRLIDAGYAVLLPNPRGSYGQGEAFTRANVRDFGGGDFRDIMAGVDAAVQAGAADPARLGITGWSYGGYMTMWAVTQTDRFRAAVAGAGLANWLSYYGENGIDGWMIPYFGASVYDDPAVYAKSAPISYVKHVRTPTLMVVGAQDIECPAPQTQEFWHALSTLGVPTAAVVYPGEGHWVHDPKHVADIEDRMVGWFDKYVK